MCDWPEQEKTLKLGKNSFENCPHHLQLRTAFTENSGGVLLLSSAAEVLAKYGVPHLAPPFPRLLSAIKDCNIEIEGREVRCAALMSHVSYDDFGTKNCQLFNCFQHNIFNFCGKTSFQIFYF